MLVQACSAPSSGTPQELHNLDLARPATAEDCHAPGDAPTQREPDPPRAVKEGAGTETKGWGIGLSSSSTRSLCTVLPITTAGLRPRRWARQSPLYGGSHGEALSLVVIKENRCHTALAHTSGRRVRAAIP
ncbi:unnamed protein product [Gadus morhua 'NCC']